MHVYHHIWAYEKVHLDLQKLIAIVMDGSALMIGERHGLVARLRENVP